MRKGRRRLIWRGVQASRNFRIRDRNLDMDLGGAALRTKRAPILDRNPALLATMLHILEASAEGTGRASKASGDRAIFNQSALVFFDHPMARWSDHPMLLDRVFLAGVHTDIDQGKL